MLDEQSERGVFPGEHAAVHRKAQASATGGEMGTQSGDAPERGAPVVLPVHTDFVLRGVDRHTDEPLVVPVPQEKDRNERSDHTDRRSSTPSRRVMPRPTECGTAPSGAEARATCAGGATGDGDAGTPEDGCAPPLCDENVLFRIKS